MLRSSEQFQNKSKLISRRMFFLSSIKIAVFVSIISRLFYLQISENIKYKTLSDKNRLREWKVPPQRGIIEDFFGNKIASNTQVFQLHMIPEDVPNLEELFFKLARIINFTENQKNILLKRLKKRKPWEPIIISDNLSWSEFSKINLGALINVSSATGVTTKLTTSATEVVDFPPVFVEVTKTDNGNSPDIFSPD